MKSLVLVDRVGPIEGGRLFLMALRRGVGRVRWVEASRAGQAWLSLIRGLGLCREVGPFSVDLTRSCPHGGALFDRVQLTTRDLARGLADRLSQGNTTFEGVCHSSPERRRRAALEKAIAIDLYVLVIMLEQTRVAPDEGDRAQNVILMAGLSDLAPLVSEAIASSSDSRRVRVLGGCAARDTVIAQIARLVVGGLAGMVAALAATFRSEEPRKRWSVAIQCAHGLTGSMFRENDLWWLEGSTLEYGQCLVYFDSSKRPATDDDLAKLRRLGCRHRILRRSANATRTGRVQGFPAPRLRRVQGSLRLLGSWLLRWPSMTAPRWQLSRGIDLLVNVDRWEAFLATERVGLIFGVEEVGLDAMSLAGDRVGAIRFGLHWSSMLAANARVGLLHHVYFVWGEAFRHAIKAHYIESVDALPVCGCIFNAPTPAEKERAAKHRSAALAKLPEGRIVAVLDRSLGALSYYPESRHVTFYESLIEWCERDPTVILMVKAKERSGPKLFRYREDLASRFKKLVQDERAHLVTCTVAEAALTADLAVSLGYNSAGVVAALQGTRSIFWDPAGVDQGPFGAWYRRVGMGLPRVTFRSMDDLVEAAGRWLSSGEPSIGDLSAACNDLDPFRDGRSAERIAMFVGTFLHGLDDGLSCEAALETTRRHYSDRWSS